MIRFDQRNFDVQATERVFKKVVHPSHHAIRLVDKDGIPLGTPTTQALSRLHSTYVLSPRGVPTKKSNHSYSGQLSQAKMQNLIKNFEPVQSQEMQSYTSMHNYRSGLSSAGSSRHYMPSNLTAKKRGFGSGPPRSVKSMPAKSASSQRTGRYLTSAAATDIGPNPDDMALDPNEKTNDSAQGKRLEKEWSALSQCRALKRSSEIVSHRVDRMYFMTGNKLKLQSKFHVEEDELQQLRELSQARVSSRASREEMREKARSLMKRRELCENDRLDNIERKLSNIEHRLSYIEEQSEEFHELRNGTRSVHINDNVDVETISRSTSESGIQEDEIKIEIEAPPDHKDGSPKVGTRKIDSNEQPISGLEIPSRQPELAGVQIWDILAHDKAATGTETMLKLFEAYPNVHARARYAWEKDEYETATELTLGVPRKIRRAKMKASKKPGRLKANKDEVIGKEMVRSCRMCRCVTQEGKGRDSNSYVLHDSRKDHLKQSFPVRKPSIKILHHPPVECDCRLDNRKSQGLSPLLSVTGTQVPLCDRDFAYT